ncbi:TonB-dependent receptor [Novosphingobium rhizosphaerae]|uniref:TonB-dependent receptor n=1 Tax=Novosphingobium rhizosphaerae TaxID=1551649 RepID=UPI003D81850D
MIHSAELKYEFDNGITLRSLTGYQDKTIEQDYDDDASQLAGNLTDYYARERQFSQEINLISPTSGRFDWILGGYLQKNTINAALILNPAGFPVDIKNDVHKTTTGIFAQGNYELTDQLEVQLGVRYSTYKTNATGFVKIGRGILSPDGIQVSDLTGAYDDGRMTGKIALNYKLDRNNLLYVFAARGYKPGGFNSSISSFGPETVNNYEIGWKSTLADGHVRLQVDAFYNDYKSFQFEIINTSSGLNGVANLPNAKIKGIEAQLQAKFGGFSADASLAYVNSKLPAFQTVNPLLLPPGSVGQLGPQCPAGTPNGPTCFNYGPFTRTAGNGPNLLSPEWTYNLGAQYEFQLGGGVTFTPRVNYAYQGSQFTRFFYNPVTDKLQSRGLLSARAVLDFGHWELEAYGRNLTNEEYVSGQTGSNEFYGAPREYGVRVRVEF